MKTIFPYCGILLIMCINVSLEQCNPSNCADEKCAKLLKGELKKMWLNKCSIGSKNSKEKAYYDILPMCLEENIYDIKDLYNPIQIGLQILKRGFCLAFGIPDTIIEDKTKTETISVNKTIELLGDYDENMDMNKEEMKIYLPIVLPDGMCKMIGNNNNITLLKWMKNEHIKCKIKQEDAKTLIRDIINNKSKKRCTQKIDSVRGVNILKGNVIFYVNEEDDPKCDLKENDIAGDYFLSLDITFRKSESEPFVNVPGFKYGDSLIKLEENDLEIKKEYQEFIPHSNTSSGYINPFIDNSLTFQDTIITSFPRISGNDLNTAIAGRYSKIINPSVKDLNDKRYITVTQEDDSLVNTVVCNFWYTELGPVNNTQKILIGGKVYQPTGDKNNIKYLFINFVKQENPKKRWYASGPRLYAASKNIMYPFKIGTTDYRDTKSK